MNNDSVVANLGRVVKQNVPDHICIMKKLLYYSLWTNPFIGLLGWISSLMLLEVTATVNMFFHDSLVFQFCLVAKRPHCWDDAERCYV